MEWCIYGMIYLGSAVMVYNIYGFVSFARQYRNQENREKADRILYIPIFLLIFFLLGYLAVGIFGEPDLIIAGILFGGSVFVCIMYHLLGKIARQIQENEKLRTELKSTSESNAAKAAFLASVSHEMRTPLNVILGLDNLALKDPAISVQTRDRLTKIGASAMHLLSLINNILVMNSGEGDASVFHSSVFRMENVIEQVNAIISTSCEEKGLTYRFDAPDGISEYYQGSEVQLKQILFSLLENAVKYTNAPGNVDFSIRTERTDGHGTDTLRFTVSDTGIGIDPDFLPHVFEVFAQEDSSSTNLYGGSGLGLAATRKLVENLGGTITAESEKNAGSVFMVILPLQRAETAEPESKPANQEVSLEGRRILIVEDLPENAEIIEDLLALEGADSEHAENGQIALDMFLRSPHLYYDAILMDLRMPVMDGLTATRRIRASEHEDAKTIPIVALTANALESDVQQSIGAGMNVHLAKPTDADMLYSVLKGLIRQESVQ